MDHKQIGDLLAGYLDNELSADEKQQVDAHLAVCRECRRDLEALKAAQRSLRQALTSKASGVAPPPQAWSRLQPELEAPRPSLLFLFRRRKWRLVATIIVLLIGVTLGVLWLTGVLPGLR